MTLELTELADLRAAVTGWREDDARIALVPTMGALHKGHLALVKRAKAEADKVVVSIFVNPTQFGPNEDFSKYPRTLADDLAKLRAAGADAAWLPSVETMYPQGFATSIHIQGITETLDGLSRPGHFDGVATVVTKLFNQVQPDTAVFGEKDYQQLLLIKRLVNDLDMNVRVIGAATHRESDGLAMSSRNRYLNEKERTIAPLLYSALQSVSVDILNGKPANVALEEQKAGLTAQGFVVDYLELRHAETLAPLTQFSKPARLLVAARLGTTRLIDNIAVE